MDNAPPLSLDPALPRPLGRDGRRLSRTIRDMRFAEIAYRGWQHASKWIELVAPSEQPSHTDDILRRHAPELIDPAMALRVVRERAPQRFFAGAADADTMALLRDRVPEHTSDVVTAADAFAKHQFDFLGYQALWFGDPIDWHLDPVRARRSPMVPWSRLSPLDPDVIGDSRVVWELNRHQWLVRLAQAYVLTGDERYALECVTAIDGWIEANPQGVGVNWGNTLEVSLRLISWCWTLMLIRDSSVMTGAWAARALAAVWQHASYVRRYRSFRCSSNTHLTGEALGLFYAGTLFPEFVAAERWREIGRGILIAESQAQIHGDGVHFEQSTCHHRYTVEIYLHFLLLAARNGIDVPPLVGERVQQMVEFLLAVRRPDGGVATIGDSDGGTLMPLAPRASDDPRGVFAVAATLFHRPDFTWAADGISSEVAWLTGSAGIRAFESAPPAPPITEPSRVFPSGGYAVMRGGRERDAHQMIVDFGPLGCPVSAGHGHADLLSIQCSIFGEPCLVDPGTFAYADPQWRNFFRSTAAHSTVMVDGLSQAEPAGPFGWRRHPRVRLREWHSTPEFDFLDAEHDGYTSLPDPVTHRRRVIFVKPGFWILVDDLTGAARHDIDLTFQFASMNVQLGPHPWARAETPAGRALWISPFPAAPVRPTLKSGDLSPIRGWISPDYGQRQPAPMLIYSAAVALPWRIVTLLLPDRQGLTAPPAVRALYDAAGLPNGFAFERPRRSVRFGDEAVSVERD